MPRPDGPEFAVLAARGGGGYPRIPSPGA
jgi:hypothetical protein